METRKKPSASQTNLSESELLEMQKQIREREKRVRDEEARLETMKADLETAQTSASSDMSDQILRELAAMRKEMNDMRLMESSRPSENLMRSSSPTVSGRKPDVDTYFDGQSSLNFTLREAIESIPIFDGKNIPVFHFIRACKRARDVLPSHAERTLTKLIINRLKGRAYLAVEDEVCNNITDLCDFLLGSFGSIKSVDHYRGQITNIYQRTGEHILDYISRIKDIRSAIVDCMRINRNDITGQLSDVDALALRCFCDGLIPEIRSQMVMSQIHDLGEAFTRAKELYRRYEIDGERYVHDRRFVTNKHINNSINRTRGEYKEMRVNRENLESPNRDQDSKSVRDKPYNFSSVETNDRRHLDKICRYCKNIGHDINECKKRQYNNSKLQGNAKYLSFHTGTAREVSDRKESVPVQSALTSGSQRSD